MSPRQMVRVKGYLIETRTSRTYLDLVDSRRDLILLCKEFLQVTNTADTIELTDEISWCRDRQAGRRVDRATHKFDTPIDRSFPSLTFSTSARYVSSRLREPDS